MNSRTSRLKIKRGSDATPIFKLRGKISDDPLDLTSVFNVTVELTKANRTVMKLDMTNIPAQTANYELDDTVSIVAVNAGSLGNEIVVVFDGLTDVDTIVSDWNTANPTNPLQRVGGTGTEIFSNGTVRLFGGLNAYSPVSVHGEPLLGKIKLILLDTDTKLLRRGDNQSVKIIVDFGAPPSGERKIAIFDDKLDIIDR